MARDVSAQLHLMQREITRAAAAGGGGPAAAGAAGG